MQQPLAGLRSHSQQCRVILQVVSLQVDSLKQLSVCAESVLGSVQGLGLVSVRADWGFVGRV